MKKGKIHIPYRSMHHLMTKTPRGSQVPTWCGRTTAWEMAGPSVFHPGGATCKSCLGLVYNEQKSTARLAAFAANEAKLKLEELAQ